MPVGMPGAGGMGTVTVPLTVAAAGVLPPTVYVSRLDTWRRGPYSQRVFRPGIPSAATAPAQPLGVAGTWTLVLEDHFDGAANSAPNTTIWDYWIVNTLRWDAMNRAENTYLDGSSNLVIRLTNANIGYGAEQSAGGLQAKATFAVGSVFEVKMIGPTGNGHATAWTQDPVTGGDDEIDFAEFIAGGLQNNIFQGGYGSGTQSPGSTGGDYSSHVYTFHWGASAYKFYCDGVLQRTYSTSIKSNSGQMFRLTQEHDNGAGPSSLVFIDYARVWTP